MIRTPKTRALLLGTLFVGLVGGGVALATSVTPSVLPTATVQADPDPASSTTKPPHLVPNAAAASSFLVFRRAQDVGDRAAARGVDQAAFDEGPGRTVGANLALARAAGITASGSSIVLIPGRQAICDLHDGVGGCASLDAIATGGVLDRAACIDGLPAGSSRLVGLVPDDTTSVAITLDDGAIVTVQPKNNVFVTDLKRPAASASWDTQGTTHREDLGSTGDIACAAG